MNYEDLFRQAFAQYQQKNAPQFQTPNFGHSGAFGGGSGFAGMLNQLASQYGRRQPVMSGGFGMPVRPSMPPGGFGGGFNGGNLAGSRSDPRLNGNGNTGINGGNLMGSRSDPMLHGGMPNGGFVPPQRTLRPIGMGQTGGFNPNMPNPDPNAMMSAYMQRRGAY